MRFVAFSIRDASTQKTNGLHDTVYTHTPKKKVTKLKAVNTKVMAVFLVGSEYHECDWIASTFPDPKTFPQWKKKPFTCRKCRFQSEMSGTQSDADKGETVKLIQCYHLMHKYSFDFANKRALPTPNQQHIWILNKSQNLLQFIEVKIGTNKIYSFFILYGKVFRFNGRPIDIFSDAIDHILLLDLIDRPIFWSKRSQDKNFIDKDLENKSKSMWKISLSESLYGKCSMGIFRMLFDL